MEKVSVIIPVYNTENYLEKSFGSILNQTYTNLELIVINDGSNEATTKKLQQYAKEDNRIYLFEFPKRRGVGHARNFGLTKATGKYIYYFDSDDYLDKSTIDLLVFHIKDNPIIRGGIRTTNFLNSYAVIFDGLIKGKEMTSDRFNLITRNASVNFLFRKDYLLENNLLHSENVEVFSDLTFIVPALGNLENITHVREALYFRRRRNDPIKNPSLDQSDPLDKANDFLKVYLELKKMKLNEETNIFIDKQLLNYYRKDIVRLFKREENIDVLFKNLSMALKQVDNEELQNYDRVFKREITPILNENKTLYKRRNSRYQILREIRNVFKAKNKRRLFYRFLYGNIFLKLPIKEELVFFESFLGKNYSDSPKAIYEKLIEGDKRYKSVWSFTETDKKLPGKAKQVKRFSLQYFYYLARAKYWVSNSRLPIYLEKHKENIYLQTWHGTPLKRLVFDMEEVFSADPNYKANFYEQSRRWDYLSSPNKYSTDIFRRAFEFNKEMLEFGYPKNDVLYNKNNKNNINSIKSKLDLPLDKKVVLYAPTWRDDDFYARGKYRFELELDLKEMKKKLGDEYIIVLRMHYFIANQLDLTEFEGFAFDYSTHDDIAELYLISDVLITDYSSVFFDYANLKRPIIFFTYDIEKYRDQLRGFYLDMEEDLPGPLLMTSKEVIDSLENIEEVSKKYADKYEQFYERFCKWEDGKASEKTVKAVFKK